MQRQPQDIEAIIHSFKAYGLGDINHNKERTISAAILSICFIDQLAAFRYRINDVAERWEQFIIDYMPIYAGLNIYKRLRNVLIHSYSGGRKFALTNDPNFKKPFEKDFFGIVTLNTNQFVENLEKAFIEYEKDLRKSNSEANYNALKRSESHPVLIHRERPFPDF